MDEGTKPSQRATWREAASWGLGVVSGTLGGDERRRHWGGPHVRLVGEGKGACRGPEVELVQLGPSSG